MIGIIQKTANVFVLGDDPGFVCPEVIAVLKKAATEHPLRRARLCLHSTEESKVHEMLIVLAMGTYIRPHRHHQKSESFHLLEGEVTILFFDDHGSLNQNRLMKVGQHLPCIYRINSPIYHTQILWSPFVVFYECTRGPYCPDDTEYAPWAPDETQPSRIAYIENLRSACADEHLT